MMKSKLFGETISSKPFLMPSNFKSYDELKEKLNRVITGTGNSGETVEDVDLPSTSTAVKV